MWSGDRDVRGKKPLGFLNPLLYSMPSSIFIDITVGKNNCSAGGPRANCCDQGFVPIPVILIAVIALTCSDSWLAPAGMLPRVSAVFISNHWPTTLRTCRNCVAL